MRRMHALLLALALALGLGAVPTGALGQDGGRSGDNAAVAVNTRDGGAVFRFAFDIARVAGEVVDNENAAVAFSQCESCRTTAIAIQIVLVSSSPSTVTPTNVALALNNECTLCQTFAAAYQFVKGTDGVMTFTKEGWRELRDIRKEIKRLKHENLTPAELDARLDPLIERIRVMLDTQLVPANGNRDDEEDAEPDGLDAEDEDERDADDRDLAPDERPTTTATVEEEGGATTPATTSADPAETAPAETAPAETTPAETTETTETTSTTETTGE